jgi:stearoyl-CoA desaturase (delta-9 desaturase)
MGLLDLSAWEHVLYVLIVTHITIASVTIYLHRHQTHRALDLHPVASHFFRFWLWLTTGTVTREWVAIHRKHHATVETDDDPHSPQRRGIAKVLFEGYELYRQEAANAQTLATYGRGTPDDWIERHLYAKHTRIGLALMLSIDVLLMGPIGLTIWAVQMLWIPFFAAGVINGVGHYWGYRRFFPNDASRNILPWGILIGGEELHNNHHAYVASARLSSRWWEIDIGWIYIRALAFLRLATVRRVAPRLRRLRGSGIVHCNAQTLRAISEHRYLVLAQFARVLKRTIASEIRAAARAHAIPSSAMARRAFKCWLQGTASRLSLPELEALEQAFHSSAALRTIQAMRADLAALWNRSAKTSAQLVAQLEDWCARAEASGIRGLPEFSLRLRGYQ